MKSLLALMMAFINEDLRPLIREIREYLKARRESLEASVDVEEEYHDAEEAEGIIGVSERTLKRMTKSGLLPISHYANRKRMFKKSDVEHCRRYYRGR